jgi:lysine 6-dehydrogenase
VKIALLGCGAMGRAAAHALHGAGTGELVLVDQHPARLEELAAWLGRGAAPSPARLRTACVDLADEATVAELIASVDVCAAALPWDATRHLFRAALRARRPIASITRPDYPDLPELSTWPGLGEGQILFPCGLEPGLTEILAVSTARALPTVRSLRIRCGGIPVDPQPPLRYRLLFDTRLPLTPRDAYAIEGGQRITRRRFQGLERFSVEGVGALECHHDGMLPWLIDDPTIARIPDVTQKTVRWPGFTERVAVLEELGLLSEAPVAVSSGSVAPRELVEAVLAPTTRRRPGDADLTVLCVEAEGLDQQGRPTTATATLVDRYDEQTGLTSMARTTGFVLASVTRMLARGDITERGLLLPQRVISGARLERLLSDLRDQGVRVAAGRTSKALAFPAEQD